MLTSTIEKRIVTWLMQNKYCKLAVNNNYVFDWECDAVGITKSYMTHEVEVKVSKSDFTADFRNKKGKHYKTKYGQGCNYFWYAVPVEMADYAITRIPEYAGLLSVNQNGYVKVLTNAPRLHNNRIDDYAPNFWETMAIKLFYKYTTFNQMK